MILPVVCVCTPLMGKVELCKSRLVYKVGVGGRGKEDSCDTVMTPHTHPDPNQLSSTQQLWVWGVCGLWLYRPQTPL